MRASHLFLVFSSLIFAASVATYAAMLAADVIEERSTAAAQAALAEDGLDWVELEADGLQMFLTGEAADEPTRFRALSAVGQVVDPSRLIDNMTVAPVQDIATPEFRIEILRTEGEISLIGLIPEDYDRNGIVTRIATLEGAREVADLLETADFETPEGFNAALDFAIVALAELPRSKVSVSADRVEIQALAESVAARQQLSTDLSRQAADSFVLALDISAPRPVVTPFTLRFIREPGSIRFDACAADTEAARDRILKAAIAAGLAGKADCVIGLGVPTPSWSDAVAAGIGALGQMPDGSLTFSDADVTLITSAATSQSDFDRIIGQLEATLPEVFSLTAVRSPAETGTTTDGPPEFLATLSPEGDVQVRGLVSGTLMRSAVEGLAQARFGADEVQIGTRTAADLPSGWSVRVLTAIDALAILDQGSVTVQPDLIAIRGLTGNPDASAQVSRLLSNKLGAEDFDISVTYSEALDPVAALPTPEECVTRLNAAKSERKITFDPGEATINASALELLDALAEAFDDCEAVPIEVAGHTDSQGRESMNAALSQTRAEAVIDALLARRVRVGNLRAVGYGESEPIADNGTEAGREANRRIEFRLIEEQGPVVAPEEDTAAAETGTPEDGEGDDGQN
ncbi:MAG: OmpA family protein [Pseudomonadota bacterium]